MPAVETNAYNERLYLLLVEDTDDDAALVTRAIRAAGFAPIIQRVETRDDFLRALRAGSWQVVVCDHSLPHFSSTEALACLQEQLLDLPFIVVSGTINEESAVGILRAGAHDFVTKQSLGRLGPAIRRELRDAKVRAERRQAQHDLRVQRDFFRIVLDTTPNLIFVKDARGRFTLANHAVAQLHATTNDALIGRTPAELGVPPSEVHSMREAERKVLETRRPHLLPGQQITDLGSGAARWFDMRFVPLLLPDAEQQVLVIGRDLTDQRQVEEALRSTEEQFRQAQKMEAIGQLAGGIAHDFNNLLTAILGYSDLLREVIREPEQAADLAEIHKAGERARSLTSQLLAFSRKQVLEPQVLDLNRVVRDAERMLSRVIGEDIQLETALEPNLLNVRADMGQMHQVLMNLAVNARDAMPRGGTLRVATGNAVMPAHAAGDGPVPAVSLTVTDTGCGMTEEVRDRIFEPFFTTKAPGKGTGLGLAMVFGVVTQSGGHVDVVTAPGQGTAFTIHFPAVAEAPTSTSAADTPAVLQGRETILLVEDERPIRELVRKVLSGYGYTVIEAVDAFEAMEMAAAHPAPVHLLLSDIVMPRMGGPELAQRVIARHPEIRVLYMSGYASGLGTGLGHMSPAVTLVHKPFTPANLVRKVRECLDR
jgi:PAS domain S-box-containing protein